MNSKFRRSRLVFPAITGDSMAAKYRVFYSDGNTVQCVNYSDYRVPKHSLVSLEIELPF